MKKRVLTAAVCLSLVSGAAAQADTIRVQSTTDTVDAGLVEGLLRGAYQQAQPGDSLNYTAVGTGAALTNARNGLADIVITHAPSLEQQFVADGYSLGTGRQIFYSDYVIAGPKAAGADAANIAAQGDTNDAIGAFEDIAAAGDAAPANVQFYSRGDNSGTNVQEQLMWGLTTTVTKVLAANGGTSTTRYEPGSRSGAPGSYTYTYPGWYVKSNVGQAANVQQADACVAGGKACYVMTDRGTLNRLINNGTVTNLKVLTERNASSARGGENLLINPFAAYVVNQDKFNDDTATKRAREAAGRRFLDFLVSPGFQQALLGFPSAVDPAFKPDAAPTITLDAALPPSAAAGTPITVAGTAKNELPGSAALSGLPVQLQRSTDGGGTWTDDGSAVATDGTGRFSVASTVTGTARYRLATPTFDVTSYNALTAATRDLGAVTVPSAGGGGTTTKPGGTNPGQTTPPDTTKPKASTLRLTRRSVSIKVNEASTVKLRIQRRVIGTVTRKGKRVRVARFRTAKTVTLKAKAKSTVRRRFHALKAGRYRVLIRVVDRAGNARSYTTKVRKVSGR